MKNNHTLIALFFIGFIYQNLSAQGQCGQNICTLPPLGPGALCAEDACVLCDPCMLDGYWGLTQATPNTCEVPGPFCGSIENNQWFAFLAPPSGEVTFHFEVYNCLGMFNGSGIQAEVYRTDDCNSFVSVSNCWNDGFQSQGDVIAEDLTPYCTYYLMVDGWTGDICEFNITVDPSACMVPPAPSTPTISGPQFGCPGTISEYTLSSAVGACNGNSITWFGIEPTGTIIGQTDESITVFWNTVGASTIYALEENICFGTNQSIPLTVFSESEPPIYIEEDLCLGECITIFSHIFCDPGFYEFGIPGPNGCDVIVQALIIPIVVPPTTIEATMPCDGSFENGVDTITSLWVTEIIHPSYEGCDSLIYYAIVPGDVDASAGPDQFFSCANPDTVALHGSNQLPVEDFIYSWETTNGNILSGDTTLTPVVDQVGTYCLTTTKIATGCILTDCTKVTNDFEFPGVEFGHVDITCGPFNEAGFCVDGDYSMDAVFDWSLDGEPLIMPGYFPCVGVSEEGIYCVTVTESNGCDSSICIEIDFNLNFSLDGPQVVCPGESNFYHFIFPNGVANAPFTLFVEIENDTIETSIYTTSTNAYHIPFSFDETSTLSAWVVDSIGCESDTISLEVQVEAANISFELEQEICNEAYLTAIYPDIATSYQWSNSNLNTQTVLIDQEGWYSVTVTDVDGCEFEKSIFVVLDLQGACAYINGSVKHDEFANCQPDANEMALEGWLVQASGSSGNYFANTDADGNYSLTVEPGDYTVLLFPPSTIWSVCQNAVAVSLPIVGSLSSVNFLVDELEDCPLMTVDLSSGLIRLCQDNLYSVKYCNEGTAIAADAYIDVTVDGWLEFQNATIAYTDLGNNVYRFQLGEVAPNECGVFTFRTQADCDAPPGFTHCTEAHVYPDDNCSSPSPLWSGASLKIAGECSDSTRFTISNHGTGNMSEPLKYLVYKNSAIFLYQEKAALAPGENHVFALPADGSTWRAEVTQEPFHPLTFLVVSIVEGCAANSSATVIPGFVNQLSQADQDHFIDEDCRPNVASFDPNVKTGSPEGYANEHFIPDGTALEYQIRFQNTGMDTAFSVLLRDTLTNLLDLSTLQMGASSHPYTYQLFGHGILKIEFPGIALPHESVDEAGSIGFVEFKISAKEGLLPLTVIENEVSIYFDYNEPVTTNTSFHTIEKPVVHGYQKVSVCEGDFWNGLPVYQNFTVSEIFDLLYYDSMAWTEVEMIPAIETNITEWICPGKDLVFGDVICSEPGLCTVVLESENGCDSVVNILIKWLDDYNIVQSASICEGGSFEFNGDTLTMPGMYEAELTTFQGCDSLVTLFLEVGDTWLVEMEEEICAGSSYEFDGQLLTEPGEYEATYVTANGCDSTVQLTLYVNELEETDLEAEICEGESYMFQGEELTESGDYKVTLSTMVGCDSVVNLSLQVWDVYDQDTVVTICEGETYLFNGEELEEEGDYDAVYSSVKGCDSLVHLSLTVTDAFDIVVQEFICEDETYEFNGEVLDTAGFYEAQFISSGGCDSSVTLELRVLPIMMEELEVIICEGETFEFQNEQLDTAGIYEALLTGENGCDSIVTLYLEVESFYFDTVQVELILGDEYQGIPIFSDTLLIENYLSVNNCDSIVFVEITVLTSVEAGFEKTLQLSIFPNPVHDRFFVRFHLSAFNSVNMKIMDVLGRKVLHQIPNSFFGAGDHLMEVETADWAAGVYLLQFQLKERTKTVKLVVH